MLSRNPTRVVRNVAFLIFLCVAFLAQTERAAANCYFEEYFCGSCPTSCTNACLVHCGSAMQSASCDYVDQSQCNGGDGCGLSSCQRNLCVCVPIP